MQLATVERSQSLPQRLGARIADLRKRKGWRQEDLADHLDVPRSQVSKWETGFSTPSAENLIALSKLFGVTTDELLTGEPPARLLLSPEQDAKLMDHLSAVLNLVK